ncbi:unnamed protein product, partial [marine sediment metagenome]
MMDGLESSLKAFESMRSFTLKNSTPPAIIFNPVPADACFDQIQQSIDWNLPEKVELPEYKEELAFYSVSELSVLIKTKKITSTDLTKFFLNRLKKFGDTLHCIITLTEELGFKQAQKADEELANGIYRGPLHGIPYGVKDLLAVEGYKTTWGAGPFKDQVIEETATIVKKLEQAGAVLIAKLSMGALAMGDVWYRDTTLNPWNLRQGSSGSSAGSATA